MRHSMTAFWCAPVRALTFVGLVLMTAEVCHAQLGNPLLPSGVGSASDIESYSRGSGGSGVLPRVPGERNPADMLLKGINGSNRGRRTGRAALEGNRRYRVRRVDMANNVMEREDKQAVVFDRLGAYEDAIYSPTRGSYRMPSRRPRTNRGATPRPAN